MFNFTEPRRALISECGDDDVDTLAEHVRREAGQHETSVIGMEDIFLNGTPDNSGQSSVRSTRIPRRSSGQIKDSEPLAKKTKYGPNWSVLENIWPANERPESLQDPIGLKSNLLGT